MQDKKKFYINGEWIDSQNGQPFSVLNPATEEKVATITLGTEDDVNNAVKSAREAFKSYSQTSKEERIELITKIQKAYEARWMDLAQAVTAEMGAPSWLSASAQVGMGWAHFPEALRVLQEYEFTEEMPRTTLLKTPVGVCGLITPWNWPLNQILCKVLPALAVGCTVILKPSEIAPLNAMLLAEIMDAAEVPPGVFNLVNGDGVGVGTFLSKHPQVNMMSFTGSTRAGILVAKNAAETVKRVSQELGGKSVNLILPDADLEAAVVHGVNSVMMNSGQTCAAPTRMLVPKELHEQACEIAKQVTEKTQVIAPTTPAEGDDNIESLLHSAMKIGPVVSAQQYEKIQGLIAKGIDEGAQLIAGGLGKPTGFENGYFVKPTVFAAVDNSMTIAQEEIFGPVLCIIPYSSVEEAISIANDSNYGLSGYISAGTDAYAKEVAAKIETGAIHINRSAPDFSAPFGGIKQSGNGREWGVFGFDEFIELKALIA